jgi:GNAT superfamily N-acetyltransferase
MTATPGDLQIIAIDPGDTDQHGLLRELVATRGTILRQDLGDLASPYTLEEYLAYANVPAWRKRPYAAVVDGAVIGGGNISMPRLDNGHLAFLSLEVLPSHRRCGIGSALLTSLENHGMEDGRTTFIVQTTWLPETTDPGEAFLDPRGYTSELPAIQSDLDLQAVNPEALPDSGSDDYEIELAWGALPDDWLEDRVVLFRRMSTDAPQGGLQMEEQAWDVDRVVTSVQASLDAGRERVEAVARHRRTGRLVGFSFVNLPSATPELAIQEDTLVLREHRGHGLGLRLKQATAAAIRASRPDVRTIRTWNAASNTPMLDVNRALGFRPVALESEWQKTLAS